MAEHGNRIKSDQDSFIQHLQECAKKVDSWPEWKKAGWGPRPEDRPKPAPPQETEKK